MRLAATAVVLLTTTNAYAYPAPCRALYRGEDVPRGLEGSYFLSTGIATTDKRAVLGLGFELTASAFGWRGFPSGYSHDKSELRYGAWLFGATRLGSGLVEGGAILDASSRYHASWGTFTIRGGVGYGALRDERDMHGVVTFIYGVRSVLARFSHDGACHRGSPERPLPEASVARFFATYRRSLKHDEHEWVFGIELSPTFFWPPLTWWRVAGGPPH
jgi:hypothetical protein